ncbi:MAG TPA: alpha/beta hydrolase [Caulobacteraceae bacterium]|nr:alpha/beta hydrolase [Caulobacteraceae bacterium]
MSGSAPLLGIEADPPPPGAAAQWVTAGDGARLRVCLVPSAAGVAARGSVVLSPGRTEPIEKYFETAGLLAGRGFTVLVHDWRGQGLSPRSLGERRLGHADGYRPFLDDYEAILGACEARLPRPWLALGHSMGGCLTLLALVKGERRFAGAILSAPMLGLLTGGVPRPAARLLARLFAALGRKGAPVLGASVADEPSPFEANVLTHDAGRYARNLALVAAAPDLALGPPTWGWLDFAFAATDVLARDGAVGRLDIPVLILAAGEDALVDNAALARVAARLPQGRLVEIAGARHEILQETDALQAPFWREFDALADRLAPA